MSDKFSAKNVGDQSLRSKAKGLEQRISTVETSIANLLVALDGRLNNMGQMFGQNAELVEAVIEAVGPDLVTEILDRKRMERSLKQEQEELKQLGEALAEGYVTPATVIEEDSFIVGHEIDANEKPLGTGRQQVAFKSLKPAFKEQLLGQSVGAVIKTPTGGLFTVREIYKLDEAKYTEIVQAKAAAEAEAAQKAAEEAATKDEN